MTSSAKQAVRSNKSPDKRDGMVGRRIRLRRLERGMSQTELGRHLGVTFQQVQKYEKGTNRVGAGRLQRIADALEVPVTFFFGAPSANQVNGSDILGFVDTAAALRLVRAYSRIRDRKVQHALVDLAERIAPGD